MVRDALAVMEKYLTGKNVAIFASCVLLGVLAKGIYDRNYGTAG